MKKRLYFIVVLLLALLLDTIGVKAQVTLPTTLQDFSAIFTNAIVLFILFYAIVMIVVGWIAMHKRNMPLEVLPFEPKTLAMMGGVSGILIALTPTGLIPQELITPFMAFVAVSLGALLLTTAMSVTAIRAKEKETPAEAASDIVRGTGSTAAGLEARGVAKEEKEELEEQDTLKRIVKFLHDHPTTRQALETIFQDHQEELRRKFGRDVIFVDEVHKLYSNSRSTFIEEEGMTELEAADILITRGEGLIQAQEKDQKLKQQLATELTYLKKMTKRIIQAVQEGEATKAKEKGEEEHILEYIILYVRKAIEEVARDINQLEAAPRTDPDYKRELGDKKKMRTELVEFEHLLKRLTEEVIAEAHYLAKDEALVGKMRGVNKNVYGRELTQERANEIKADSRLRIE